jgi:hypothetical protein
VAYALLKSNCKKAVAARVAMALHTEANHQRYPEIDRGCENFGAKCRRLSQEEFCLLIGIFFLI